MTQPEHGNAGRYGFLLGCADAVIARVTEDGVARVNYKAFRETEAYQGFDEATRREFEFGWNRGYGQEIGADPLDFGHPDPRYSGPEDGKWF